MLKMLKLWAFVLALGAVLAAEDLPTWITNNPGFQNPTERDSIKTGNGSLSIKSKGDKGWVIYLNEKAGHGVEVDVECLNLNSDSNEFLLISKWPLTSSFKQIKLFTGNFIKTLKKLRIPNTKTIYVLYSASSDSSELVLNYNRYGVSFEVNNLPTEPPIKEKETVFEVQLKGRAPEEFSIQDFLLKVKEGIRAAAHRYSTSHKIPFNESIPTAEMVVIHRISFCPYEWPERHICASLEHSVFVSGVRLPDDELILDYQLIADHLKVMWNEDGFPELRELGLTVFQLPPIYSTAIYWVLIIGVILVFSLLGLYLLFKANQINDINSRKYSAASKEMRKVRRPKLKLAKHQGVPSFIFSKSTEVQKNVNDSSLHSKNESVMFKDKFEDLFKPEGSSDLPIKNYFGSILFSTNRAFEDDEDKPAELSPQSPLK